MTSVVSMKLAECVDRLAEAGELGEFVFKLNHKAKKLIAQLLENLDLNDNGSTHNFFCSAYPGFAGDVAQIINKYLELEDDTIIPGIFLNCQGETIGSLKAAMPTLLEIEANPTSSTTRTMPFLFHAAGSRSQASYEGSPDSGSEDPGLFEPRL